MKLQLQLSGKGEIIKEGIEGNYIISGAIATGKTEFSKTLIREGHKKGMSFTIVDLDAEYAELTYELNGIVISLENQNIENFVAEYRKRISEKKIICIDLWKIMLQEELSNEMYFTILNILLDNYIDIKRTIHVDWFHVLRLDDIVYKKEVLKTIINAMTNKNVEIGIVGYNILQFIEEIQDDSIKKEFFDNISYKIFTPLDGRRFEKEVDLLKEMLCFNNDEIEYLLLSAVDKYAKYRAILVEKNRKIYFDIEDIINKNNERSTENV